MNSIVQLLKNSNPDQLLSNPAILQALGLNGKSQQEISQLTEKAKQMSQGKTNEQLMEIVKNMAQQQGIDVNGLRKQLGI